MSNQRLHPTWIPWMFLAPFLMCVGVFTVYPLAQSLSLSLHQTFGPRASVYVGWDNFLYMAHDPMFWKALRNTVIFTSASIFFQVPISLALAILLNHPKLRGRALFRLVFFSPSLVGMVFVGMIFSLVFEKRTGLINVTLAALIPNFDVEFPWLQIHVMPALVIAALWMYAGFNMIYFLAALQNVPEELLEAAQLDGASSWDRFRHVTLPHIMPVASFVVLLSLIGSFQLFELPYILLGGSGPEDRGLTLVMYLYNTGFLTGDLGYASAIGWMLTLLLACFAWLQHRFITKENV